MDFCKGELMNLCTALQKLQTNAGMNVSILNITFPATHIYIHPVSDNKHFLVFITG